MEAKCVGSHLQSQHSVGRGKWIFMTFRPVSPMWWDPVQPGTPSEPILIKRGSDNMAERKEGEEEEGEEEGLKLTCMPFGVT